MKGITPRAAWALIVLFLASASAAAQSALIPSNDPIRQGQYAQCSAACGERRAACEAQSSGGDYNAPLAAPAAEAARAAERACGETLSGCLADCARAPGLTPSAPRRPEPATVVQRWPGPTEREPRPENEPRYLSCRAACPQRLEDCPLVPALAQDPARRQEFLASPSGAAYCRQIIGRCVADCAAKFPFVKGS